MAAAAAAAEGEGDAFVPRGCVPADVITDTHRAPQCRRQRAEKKRQSRHVAPGWYRRATRGREREREEQKSGDVQVPELHW